MWRRLRGALARVFPAIRNSETPDSIPVVVAKADEPPALASRRITLANGEQWEV